MISFIQEKKKISFLIVIILFLLIGVFYMKFVKPIRDEISLTNLDVQNLEMDLHLLNAQIKVQEEKTGEYDWDELQIRLPSDRKIDEFLLLLRRVEASSASQIGSISFSNYDDTLSEAELNQNQDESITGTENNSEENSEQTQPSSNGLENVRTITVSLSVTSPDYAHSQQFLKGIENLERITRVDNLSFSNNPREDSGPITMNMQLTTFYFQTN